MRRIGKYTQKILPSILVDFIVFRDEAQMAYVGKTFEYQSVNLHSPTSSTITLVNVYVDLLVFTRIAGTS